MVRKNPIFILASTSARRTALLTKIGLVHKVVPSNYKEDMHLPLSPEKLTTYLALQKARHVAATHKEDIIIAADTIVVCDNTVLGKAHTKEEARKMLRMLSGKKHHVITGLTVIIPGVITENFAVSSTVYFKKLTPEEINWYVATGEPLEKAGGYAIQERGGLFVEKIEGSYSSVVGLPLEVLYEILKKHNVFNLTNANT